MTTEELSRILTWLVSGLVTGMGIASDGAWFELVQPEVIGAAGVIVAAVWRAFRPPVVAAVE